MINIDLIAGARPNFIKIASLTHALKKYDDIKIRLVHTGQHYDKKMSKDFFDQLGIPEPDINLEVGSGTQAEQAASIMTEYEKVILPNTDLCIVVGDVNSTMACAITAKKKKIKVAHVEGGIRSFDNSMPEEINRIITDSLSDYFFTTSKYANEHLVSIGVTKDKIFFVGNTMIDTLIKNLSKLKPPSFYNDEQLEEKNFFLMTLHRPANVDDAKNLKKLLTSISNNCANKKVIFPVHPRTRKILNKFSENFNNILYTEPLPYLEFNYLLKNCLGVITDSGGITEEATFLKIPCITIRENTERPETIHEGTNILVGNDSELLGQNIKKIISNNWKDSSVPEKWDGKSGERIAKALVQIYSNDD